MMATKEDVKRLQEGTVRYTDLLDVVEKGQCIGCGFCSVPLKQDNSSCSKIGLDWSPEEEYWVPKILERTSVDEDRRVCPGAVMNMPGLADEIYGTQPADEMVGHYLHICAGYAADTQIRKRAASGGISTSLLTYLFQAGEIDIAYCTAGLSPHNGKAIIAHSATELEACAGSHYHPVNFGAALPALAESEKRFAFVGLPCEIAALRTLMRYRPDIADRCILTVGLFCGGINRFSGIGRYLSSAGVDPEKVTEIDYRDGDWPGQIRLKEEGKAATKSIPRIKGNSRWNILRYMVSFQGYWMLPRCRICPDQISDFADIAVGDPHLSRFKKQSSEGISAIVARSQKGMDILNAAEKNGMIITEPLSRDELVKSQGYTLENRRYTNVYIKMARKLGMVPPQVRQYKSLRGALSWHQHIYAFVDLGKIRVRQWRWLQPFYVPLQVAEYLFLTFSPRLILTRINKLIKNK